MRGPNQRAIKLARRLRGRQTDAETKFWNRVRNRQIDGYKFVRQEPIEGYICDFVCRERRVIVEVDGGQHNKSATDSVRDRRLNEAGYRVLRFWNHDVLGNIDGVLTALQIELLKQEPLTPTLSP